VTVRKLLPAAILALLSLSCLGRGPRIDRIDPRIGNMGEVLTIEGSGFRDERGEGRVLMAGAAPTSSSYIDWSDTRISVRIPDFGESGLVYVVAGGKKSNPALFTNRASVPLPISADSEGIGPIAYVAEPAAAAVGEVVTITGKNFGAARENGAVLFSWEAETPPSAPASVQAPTAIEATDLEFAYEMWSDREIRVRVPDGAISGNLIVKTVRGSSAPLFFEVSGRPGTKRYKDRKSYVFNYSADVAVSRASGPGILYLWVPEPASGPTQRNRQLINRSVEPFVESYRGASLFQFKDLASGASAQVNLSYLVDAYAVETQVKPSAIKKERQGPIRSAYTVATPLVPSQNREVAKLAEQITGKEKNPYARARLIYDWLLAEGHIGTAQLPGGALEALAARKADAYSAALLFCALARANGIPALPVAGYAVDRNRTALRHWWAEFWIDDFGWIPVDPAFGAGAVPPAFQSRPDARDFYFGNMDNQRIVFSRGEADLSPMDPRGRTATRARSYAFQSIWEESVGGLDAYSSLWNDIVVSGVY
jgi:transglutaminase-like putative cysteine protease